MLKGENGSATGNILMKKTAFENNIKWHQQKVFHIWALSPKNFTLLYIFNTWKRQPMEIYPLKNL